MALQEEFEQQGNWLFKHRSYLPLFVLLIGLALFIKKEINPEDFILTGTTYEFYYEMLALAISIVGFWVRAYTVGHTPKNTSGRNTTEGQVADTLNTTGIYSIVRHPLYLGNFLMWFGPAMLTGHFWFIVSFCLYYWVYYERIMFAEEQFLRKKFGKVYLEWAEKVPAFIPRFKSFKKSNLPFNWKKVLRKEKNGLLALFLIFTAFDIAGEVVKNETNYNYFLIVMALVCILYYLVIRILTKRSKLLVN